MGTLDGRRVAILATDGVEEVELTEPRDAVTEAGATAEIVSLDDGEIQAMNGDIEPAGNYRVDRRAADVSASDYDAVIMPGGTVNADRLRMDDDVLRFVKDVFAAGKPVGAICHAPWTLVEAGSGRGANAHLVPEPAHRHPQRGRQPGGRGGRHRRRVWSRAATRTTCPRSARRSSRPSRDPPAVTFPPMAFRLRPVEHGFFPLFARAGENIKVATHALALMVAAEPGARAGLARRVKDAELAGDWTNGFHDAANAIATSVATRALTPRVALAMAAVMNLVGAFLGTQVASTVGSGIIAAPQGTRGLLVVLAALLGAISGTW